jgi:hypothetical protein
MQGEEQIILLNIFGATVVCDQLAGITSSLIRVIELWKEDGKKMTRDGWEMRIEFRSLNMNGRDNLEDLDLDGRIILKCKGKAVLL